jgi:hypothetical protein
MEFDFPTLIGALSDEERIRFYEILAHNLTVCVRGIWVNDHLSDSKKLDCLKWLNEIMHRVTMKAALLRVKKNEYSETDSWEDIKHWVSRSPEISRYVEWALKFSYEYCRADK